ncbi:MAG: exosortase V [Sphingomonadaceae bacterium]|jgi:exosortase
MASLASAQHIASVPRQPSFWLMVLGLCALVGPTLVSLAQQYWSRENGVHGPIVLATGLWLLWRARAVLVQLQQPGHPLIGGGLIAVMLPLYVFGRAFDFLSLEVAALLGVLGSVFYLYFGRHAVRHIWFPLVYLGFLVPPPGWLIDAVTAGLKSFVSIVSTQLLALAGYPVARIGVTLYVAQFQLLVEDACSGMNSLVSLTSVSLFYIYLLHASSWRYALFLTCWILPIAILANIFRVLVLVLITYYWGNEAAQGFLHNSAGLAMFVAALLGIFAIDRIWAPLMRKKGWV